MPLKLWIAAGQTDMDLDMNALYIFFILEIDVAFNPGVCPDF